MNWERTEGKLKQRKVTAVHHRERIKNDEFAAIGGKPEQLVKTLQDKYGITKEEAKRQVDEFRKIVEQWKNNNGKLIGLQKLLNKNTLIVKTISKKRNK
jgi:uncharacterized protein YjbJ (UPF0337 family)